MRSPRGLIAFLLLLGASASMGAGVEIAGRFDHRAHMERVFKPNAIQCAECHNFAIDPKTGKAVENAAFTEASFKRPVKEICHGCHRSSEAKWEKAPKTCFTCHRSMENLVAIKPLSHGNIAWKSSHGSVARVDSSPCMNCHMSSQCAKCHLRRNDIEMVNHSRNFRFYHSVVVRAQPERCDACHTKSWCVNCHLGRK